MSEQHKSPTHVFTAPIAIGVDNPHQHINYLWDDVMTDHNMPYAAAGNYWELQAAMTIFSPWNEEMLLELVKPTLYEHGWDDGEIESALSYPDRRLTIIEKGIDEAIRQSNISASHNETFSQLYFGEADNIKKYICKFFYVPLPDETQFTMVPVLFEHPTTPQESTEFWLFMSEHTEDNIMGDREKWLDTWRTFWQKQDINNHEWKTLHHDFWKSLWEGTMPSTEIQELISAMEQQMEQLISDHHETFTNARGS